MADSIAEIAGLPKKFGALPGYGGPGVVRYPWTVPALAAAPTRGWCCQCVDEDGADAWPEALAPYILREPEWTVWRHIPNAAAQRRWMRGRVAAKDAVRLLLRDRFGVMATLEAIGVLPGACGQPRVACGGLPATGAGILVSISHSGKSSVALAAERSEVCRGVGIDVVSLDDHHDGLAEGGFAATETALLDDCPLPERHDWLLRLWCAKEAVGKALGVGLRGDPLTLVVRQVDRARGTVEVEPNDFRESDGAMRSPAQVTARVGSDRGMAFAVACLEER